MKTFVGLGNLFADSIGKQCAEWRNDWNKSELEDKFSLCSVLLIPLYMLNPFTAMWLVNVFILIGFCLFLAPIVMKVIAWKEPSILLLRGSLIAGLWWGTMMCIMFTYR